MSTESAVGAALTLILLLIGARELAWLAGMVTVYEVVVDWSGRETD